MAFGGIEFKTPPEIHDDVHLLDISGGTDKTWIRVSTQGTGPGERAEHATFYRRLAEGGHMMVSIGGIDEPAVAGTPIPPALAVGAGASAGRPAAAPRKVQSDAKGLTVSVSGAGASWSRLGNTTGGQPRADHSAVWFPDEDAAIIFGGRSGETSDTAVNDVYRLVLTASRSWDEFRGTGTPPSKRYAHTAIYDPVAKRMIVYGGTADGRLGLTDLYALDLSQGWDKAAWSKLSPGGAKAPVGRFDHAAVYLPELRWMLVFAGTRDGRSQMGDVWALDLGQDPPVWLQPAVSGAKPGDVYGHGGAPGLTGSQALFYGGQTGWAANRQTRRDSWQLSCSVGDLPTPTPTGVAVTDTPTPGPTDLPTATPTVGATDVTVTGLVYDASKGTGAPIAGARVAVGMSGPHQPFTAVTGADGRYSVMVPAQYLPTVDRIEVTASGFESLTQAVTGADLAAQPARDFGLTPAAVPTDTPTIEPTLTPIPTDVRIFAPVVVKEHVFGAP